MHLLLGGVLLLPYLGLAVLFVQSFRIDPTARGGLALLLLVAVVVSVAIALIPAVRVLEVIASLPSSRGRCASMTTTCGTSRWSRSVGISAWFPDHLPLPRELRRQPALRAPNASDDELVAVARVAHLHDIVASLPEGYDTLVADRGHRLSTVLAADLIVELDPLGQGEQRPRRRRG